MSNVTILKIKDSVKFNILDSKALKKLKIYRHI